MAVALALMGMVAGAVALVRDELINAAFSVWWQDSYGRPPGNHAVMTHTAFAKHILETLK